MSLTFEGDNIRPLEGAEVEEARRITDEIEKVLLSKPVLMNTPGK